MTGALRRDRNVASRPGLALHSAHWELTKRSRHTYNTSSIVICMLCKEIIGPACLHFPSLTNAPSTSSVVADHCLPILTAKRTLQSAR